MYLALQNYLLMKLNRFFLVNLLLAFVFVSCEKDEEEPAVEPPRDRGEQDATDQQALQEYLETHYYNYEDFQDSLVGNNELVIDTISGADSDKTPLIESDLLEEKTLTYEGIDYKYYVLKVREGVGERPSFADSTFVAYRGELLDQTQFDASENPVWFDLASTIPGFSHGITEFRGASGYQVQPDNTVVWKDDYGIGAIFLPSGLGYFNNPKGAIPAYSPLVFIVNLLQVNEADHDQDTVLSLQEDIDGDKLLYNDDTDGDRVPDYLDVDDDGDYIPTKEEAVLNEDGNFVDSDGDGIPDYLDEIN